MLEKPLDSSVSKKQIQTGDRGPIPPLLGEPPEAEQDKTRNTLVVADSGRFKDVKATVQSICITKSKKSVCRGCRDFFCYTFEIPSKQGSQRSK
jgi:hypothetical protein